MECLIGLVCADCVLLASDTSAVQSIVVLKKDEDKVVKIGDNAAMAIVGPGGDGYVQIGEMNSACASERARGRIMPVGLQGAAGILGSQRMWIVLSLKKLVIFIVLSLVCAIRLLSVLEGTCSADTFPQTFACTLCGMVE